MGHGGVIKLFTDTGTLLLYPTFGHLVGALILPLTAKHDRLASHGVETVSPHSRKEEEKFTGAGEKKIFPCVTGTT